MALFVTEGDQLGERLKQQLTDMLEFAEEELQCDRVLLGVSRRRQDKDALLKTLLFLGFAGYNPRPEERQGIEAGDFAYMVYQIAD
uniref:Ornithine decarboxylase antizyme n=2 Tax=Macrostomum lignano TaxID=282301 RepID=A0A1I8GT44_9PLAT